MPYLAGERFPVMDPKIRGACVGIGAETSPAQLARACLEGVAFSIRQGLEALNAGEIRKISLVGGGAKTELWRQIFADVLQRPVAVPKESSEYLPSAALCAAVFIDQRLETSYESFLATLPDAGELVYEPSQGSRTVMEAQYQRYRKLYPALKSLFS